MGKNTIKLKIETIVEIDLDDYFDNIPNDSSNCVNTPLTYMLESTRRVIDDAHMHQVEYHMQWMSRDEYQSVKQNILVSQEIGKQVSENAKISIIYE
jgi:adenosyl cobinamide kinase/adenosyl cobinamide phosphate guanylyltransferase